MIKNMQENRQYRTREIRAVYGLVAGATIFVAGLIYTGLDDNLDRSKIVTPVSISAGLLGMVLSAWQGTKEESRR